MSQYCVLGRAHKPGFSFKFHVHQSFVLAHSTSPAESCFNSFLGASRLRNAPNGCGRGRARGQCNAVLLFTFRVFSSRAKAKCNYAMVERWRQSPIFALREFWTLPYGTGTSGASCIRACVQLPLPRDFATKEGNLSLTARGRVSLGCCVRVSQRVFCTTVADNYHEKVPAPVVRKMQPFRSVCLTSNSQAL